MISREELHEIKEKKRTSLYYAEKEYLQYLFLYALSRTPEHFTFKGGTCLRICYELERASEDLDFSTTLKPSQLKEFMAQCLRHFSLVNIPAEIYAEKEFEGNIRFEVRCKGPLFTGKSASTNTLKIDFNKGTIIYKIAKVVPRLFSDVPAFTIITAEEKEILAEKIRALIKRAEPRDLYDIWMLISKKVPLDKHFLLKKLREEKRELTHLRFPPKEEYEQDLRVLISYVPPYVQVKKDVTAAIQKLQNAS